VDLLGLIEADDLSAELRAPADWSTGLPDLSGLAKYTVALRHPADPPMLTREERHAGGGGYQEWESALREPSDAIELRRHVRQWAARIVRLIRARGCSMTFHGCCVDLTGGRWGGDTGLGRPAERGLWLAVERGALLWANVGGVIRFAPRPRACGCETCAAARAARGSS
jgi:hypothetical protein